MTTIATRLLDALPRPLDFIPWIKLKFAILLGCAGAVGLAYFGWRIGWFPVWTSIWGFAIALVTSQVLAHGMTKPLREMTAAARTMASGDYTKRVRATSKDEVGQLASAFNQMAADLDAADRQRRELIANVSHELRTPISALRAVLENLVDGVTTPDTATLRTALAQSERLGTLVTELLDLSRIDAGVHALDQTTFELEPLFAEVIAEADVNASGAGRAARLHSEVTPARALVHADRARLHQVLVSLLDNAVRHGPPDGKVFLSGSASAAGAVIEVRDEGPGIPAEERQLVFQRFTRGERANDGGTGCLIRITLPANAG